jgi:hypothetical protein
MRRFRETRNKCYRLTMGEVDLAELVFRFGYCIEGQDGRIGFYSRQPFATVDFGVGESS